VRAVGSVDAFLADRFGSYFVARHFLVWCSDARLGGVVFWGTPDATDVRELERVFALDPVPGLDQPYDVIADGRRVERVVQTAFEPFARIAARRLRAQPLMRRLAVVAPHGLVGTVMAGFFHLFAVGGRQRLFSEAGAAFAWLERGDALAELEAVIAAELGEPPLVTSLRGWLATHLAHATVDDAARALKRSSRSLQRELAAAATSFRREIDRARATAARARLADSDVKVEALALELGCRSVASFAKLFRRVTGETPTEFRARAARTTAQSSS
jgi:AraC-like DNA-binding protein